MSEENKNIEEGFKAEGKRLKEEETVPVPESFSDSQASALDLKPSTLNPQPSEMEVHHHTHSGHGKKTWKGYFWEFIMLFLAVFCGFLAEYQLEHIIEHQREEQYMISMIKDLGTDTLTISNGTPLRIKRISAIDTVFMFFNEHPDAKTISGKLFRTIRRTNWDSRFTRNNITINQLKNAGGMRLVRNKEVADSISSYDLRCEDISVYYDFYIINAQIGTRQFEKLFNAADLLPLYISNTTAGIVNNIPDSLVIRINTSGLNEQLNFMMQEKAYSKQAMDRYEDLKHRAVRLMELIKKEYHLDQHE
ncbi:MAG: hypothetical protein ABI741_12185 [Ferruginibacter sp.]